jgi:hypothetical protein
VPSAGENWRARRQALVASLDLIVARRLDPHSRLHLQRFTGQVALLVLCCVPALLLDKDAPVLFLSLLRAASSLTALVLFIMGFFFASRSPGPRFGPWDHCLGFVLVQLGCSIALHAIRR